MSGTLCIAHRGASAEAPENTLAAFARAIELGVDGIELDVQVTRDGVPVVFHDSSLWRLTGRGGRIAGKTWAVLRELRVKGEPIPRLADAMELARGKAILQVEIKPGVLIAPVLREIRRTNADPDVILGSKDAGIVAAAAEKAPRLPRMLIAGGSARSRIPEHDAVRLIGNMAAVGAGGLSLERRLIRSKAFVEAVHRRGGQIWCWTVNTPGEMRRLRDFGVDAILSDDPAMLIRTIRSG